MSVPYVERHHSDPIWIVPIERQCIHMNKRTSFITAGAVTGVLLAGTAAVGANIGILNAADNGDVGQLSAAVATTPVTVSRGRA